MAVAEQCSMRAQPDGELMSRGCLVTAKVRQIKRYGRETKGLVDIGVGQRRPAEASLKRGQKIAGLRVAGVAADAGILDQIGQMVARALQRVHQIGVDRQPVAAHLVQHGFKAMGKGDQGGQLERPGTALDRMDGAKNRVDRLVGVVAGKHPGQTLAQGFQQFFTFLEKHVADGGLRAHPMPSPR